MNVPSLSPSHTPGISVTTEITESLNILHGFRTIQTSFEIVLRHASNTLNTVFYFSSFLSRRLTFISTLDESNSSYDGQVRLVSEIENSSISISSGRIEIHHNGVWGTVCNRDFNQAAADTVCRQLSYTNALDIYSAL